MADGRSTRRARARPGSVTDAAQRAPRPLDTLLAGLLEADDGQGLVGAAHLLCDVHLGLPVQTEAAWATVLRNGGLIYPVLFKAMRHLMQQGKDVESFVLAQRWKVPLFARPYIDRHREQIRGQGREELELAGFYAAHDTLCEGVRQLADAEDAKAAGRALQWLAQARRGVREALDARALTEPVQALRLGRIVEPDGLIDALHERGGAVCLLDFFVAPQGMFVHVLGRRGGQVDIRAVHLRQFTMDVAMEVGRIYEAYVVRQVDPDRVAQALDDVCDLLHNRLWCPLAQELGKLGYSQIILVPDAWTRPLPHHLSKVCGQEVAVPADVPVVQRERIADLFPLEFAPAVQAVAISQWQLRPKAIANVLMVADAMEDLPGAAWTAEWLGPRLSKDVAYRALVGRKARRRAVLEAMADATVIVVSGHGHYVVDDALRSHLRLSDGRITLGDLLDGKGVTPGAVYVLSTCELGIGAAGEVVQGHAFPAALLAGGAACVLAALWEMEDISFGYLTERFLHHLAFPGHRPAAALFRAMNDTKAWPREAVVERLQRILAWLDASGRSQADPSQRQGLETLLDWARHGAGPQPFRDPAHWGGAVVFGSGWATQSGAHIADPAAPLRAVEVMLARKGEAVSKLIRAREFAQANAQLQEWLGWAHGPERVEPCTLLADLARDAGAPPPTVAALYARAAQLGRAHGQTGVEDYARQQVKDLRQRS